VQEETLEVVEVVEVVEMVEVVEVMEAVEWVSLDRSGGIDARDRGGEIGSSN
jgi:hypothetical protein